MQVSSGLRRIKCDETHPECRKCTGNGRKCEGYNPELTRRQLASTVRRGQQPPSSSHTPSSALSSRSSLVKLPYKSEEERLSFENFLVSAATTAQHFATANLWRQLMPQSSHEDSTINQLVLALGMTHSHFLFCGPGDHARDYSIVKMRYGKALKSARDTTARSSEADIPLILLACVLFVTLDLQLFDFNMAAAHLQVALKLAAYHKHQLELKGYKKAHNSDLTTLASDSLNRIDLQMSLIGWFMFYTIHPVQPLEELAYVRGLPRYNFKSVDEARRTIVDLFRSIWRIYAAGYVQVTANSMRKANPEHLPQASLKERRAHNQASLDLWKAAFDSFTISHRANYQKVSPPTEEYGSDPFPLLSSYHLAAQVILDASTMTDETGWDRHFESFVKIVDLVELFKSSLPQTSSSSSSSSYPDRTTSSTMRSERPTITCELGISYPLILVATKCRDPLIRRRAVNLLDQQNRIEGPFATRFAACVIGKMIETEEEAASRARMSWMPGASFYECRVQQASDIPEFARVSHVRGDTSNPRLGIQVKCVKIGLDGEGHEFPRGAVRFPQLT
ncbi:MAG: hypothetical protein M1831_006892 [Alyxoria varia]|nr:MAG: hypothetical protein M1831_006892 [Alyxoria varia]